MRKVINYSMKKLRRFKEIEKNLTETDRIISNLGQLEDLEPQIKAALLNIRQAINSAAILAAKNKPVPELSCLQKENQIKLLKKRFKENSTCHPGISWEQVSKKLQTAPTEKLWSLYQMEKTGGEPDVFDFNNLTGQFIFYDFSQESPSGRRDIVYDIQAEEYLKQNFPDEILKGNAVTLKTEIGIEILDEEEYMALQCRKKVDHYSRTLLKTGPEERKKGLVRGGYRFGNEIFIDIYNSLSHNPGGGFRGKLII